MKIIYSQGALQHMHASFYFLKNVQGVPKDKIIEIRTRIRSKVKQLLLNPDLGQREERLASLHKDHRRLIEGNFKIIYYVKDDVIFVTDIFDARQDPKKMKG